MARIGVGLIGVGQHGIRYVRHIVADAPDLRLVAIARRDVKQASAVADEVGCAVFDDYRDLIAHSSVEAVIAVVPPTLHVGIVEAAAASKRALLLEKPAAPNLTDGRRMLQVARAAGIPVMVAQTLRYSEVVRTILDARPRIGAIHALRLSQSFEPSRPGWIDDPAISGGGIILHTGVHSFDLMRLFSGMEADRVSCELAAVKTQHTEDNFNAVVRLAGGKAIAGIAGSRATASRSGPIDLEGEGGHIIGDHIFGTVSLVQGRTVTPLPVPPTLPTVREIVRDFARVLSAGLPMPIPLEEGLRAVALSQACYASAKAGTAVPVERIE